MCVTLYHLYLTDAEGTFSETRLTEKQLPTLNRQLKKRATEWWEIGMYLGFCPGELSTTEAHLTLMLSGPPGSWLRALLEEWVQWAPGDSRGSTNFATLEGLKAAPNESGLGATAHDLKVYLCNVGYMLIDHDITVFIVYIHTVVDMTVVLFCSWWWVGIIHATVMRPVIWIHQCSLCGFDSSTTVCFWLGVVAWNTHVML